MVDRSIWNSDAALEDRLRYYLGPGSESLVQMLMFLPNMVPGGGDAMDIYGSSSALADAVSNLDPKEMLLQTGNLAASTAMVGLPGNKSGVDALFGVGGKQPGQWLPEDIYDSNFMYSPSLLAAMNMPQARGPYEQLRAAMIQNGGAKAEELGWTGADRAFAGKEVTREELVNYLQRHQDQTQTVNQTATGTLGAPDATNTSIHDLQGSYIEGNIDSEVEFLRDAARERWASESKALGELSPEELDQLTRDTGLGDLTGYLARNPHTRVVPETYGYAIFRNENEYLRSHDFDEEAYRSLSQQTRQMSREELMEAVHGADAPSFDPEDTQFSKYALPGGTNYTESFSTYQPNVVEQDPSYTIPDPMIRADQNANAHFGAGTSAAGEDIPTLFSTRSARYPVSPSGITHHVQESQSDFAQGSRSRAAGNAERNLRLDTNARRASLNRQYGLGGNYDDLPGFDIGTLPPGGSDPHTQNIQGLLGEEALTDRWGVFTGYDDALVPRGNFTRTAEDAGIARSPVKMATPEQEFTVQDYAPNTGRSAFLYEDLEKEYGIEPDKLEAYVPFGPDELPLTVQGRGSNQGAVWAADPRRQQLADLDKQMKEAAKLERETLPAAPFMRTTDQWNERALKEELGKAVAAHARGEGITHFTTGTGFQNIDLVGGKPEGQRKFYDDIQIKNLDKLLKRYGGKSQPMTMVHGKPNEPVTLDTVSGQEFTEPFVSAVRKKGIPKFAFLPLGVMGAGGLYTYGQQDENKGVPYAL